MYIYLYIYIHKKRYAWGSNSLLKAFCAKKAGTCVGSTFCPGATPNINAQIFLPGTHITVNVMLFVVTGTERTVNVMFVLAPAQNIQ